MRLVGVITVAISAAGLAAAPLAVQAQPVRQRVAPAPTTPPSAAPSQNSLRVRPEAPGQLGPQQQRRTLQWDSVLGRWGVRVDVDQPAGRDVELRDVQGGVYYNLSRRFSVGGGVVMGESPPDRRDSDTAPPPPRVRLESAFKF